MKTKIIMAWIICILICGSIVGTIIYLNRVYSKIDNETKLQCIDGMNLSKTSVGDIFFSDDYNKIRIKCE